MSSQRSDQRIQTACLLTLSAVAVGAALYWLKPVMVPFVLAMILMILLQPVIDFLELRARAPHWLAIAGALFLALVSIAGISAIGAATIAQMSENSDAYVEQIETTRDKVQKWLPEWLAKATGVFEESRLAEGDELSGVGAPAEAPENNNDAMVAGLVRAGANLVLNLFQQAVLVALFMLFLLPGSRSAQLPRNPTWEAMHDSIKQYLGTKMFVSAVTGLLTWGILQVLGVQPALVFGLFAFLLNFIPSVGSIMATVLPLPVVMVDPNISITVGVLAIVLPGTVQFTVGNVVEPKMMGNTLDLHPVVVMITLLFWGALWGPVGMLLATPLTAMLKIFLERMEQTSSVAELLAGRIAAAPAAEGAPPASD